jgi:HD-like signal output (HDOD) protein
VGKLLLVDNQADAYLQMLWHGELDGAKLIEAEHAAFSATHAEVGAYLLDLWGLPLPLVEAVAYHHEPARAGHLEPGALTFVHAANALEHEAPNMPPADTLLDLDYLERLSFASRVEDWRQELAEL